jgi:streptogramin lyase
VALAAAAAGIVVAATAGLLLIGGSDGLSGVEPGSVGVIDPVTSEVVASIPLGFESSLIAAGESFVWVLDPSSRTLTKIDPRGMKVVSTDGIPARGLPTGLAAGEGSVWVAVNQDDRIAVIRIGPELANLEDEITIERATSGTFSTQRFTVVLTAGGNAVWALEFGPGEVTRIDPETEESKTLDDGFGASMSIAVDDQAIWLGGRSGVIKVDPATGSQLNSEFVSDVVDSTATSIAIGKTATWFTANSRPRLWQLTPEGSTEDSFPVGDGPTAVSLDGDGNVWVAAADGTLTKLDPAQGTQELLELGSAPGGIVAGFGHIWTSPCAPLREG